MKAHEDEGQIWGSILSKCCAPKITHNFWGTCNVKKTTLPHNPSVMRSPLAKEAILTITLSALKLTHMQGIALCQPEKYIHFTGKFYWMDWILFWMCMFNGNITMRNLSPLETLFFVLWLKLWLCWLYSCFFGFFYRIGIRHCLLPVLRFCQGT